MENPAKNTHFHLTTSTPGWLAPILLYGAQSIQLAVSPIFFFSSFFCLHPLPYHPLIFIVIQ
jgi:hypothetical protein